MREIKVPLIHTIIYVVLSAVITGVVVSALYKAENEELKAQLKEADAWWAETQQFRYDMIIGGLSGKEADEMVSMGCVDYYKGAVR